MNDIILVTGKSGRFVKILKEKNKKLNLKFELLADEDKTSLKAYKAWAKKK